MLLIIINLIFQNEQKAQVWAFLLWKDTQIQQETTDKDSVTSWKLYQKWCKMEQHVRETWITAGRTIQAFTKINNAKMTDMRSHNTDGMLIQPLIALIYVYRVYRVLIH